MSNTRPKVHIRKTRADELAQLPEIETLAGRRFQQVAELVDAAAVADEARRGLDPDQRVVMLWVVRAWRVEG